MHTKWNEMKINDEIHENVIIKTLHDSSRCDYVNGWWTAVQIRLSKYTPVLLTITRKFYICQLLLRGCFRLCWVLYRVGSADSGNVLLLLHWGTNTECAPLLWVPSAATRTVPLQHRLHSVHTAHCCEHSRWLLVWVWLLNALLLLVLTLLRKN